jgi:predicted permease
VDVRVLFVSLAAATAIGLLVGAVPALGATNVALARGLRSGVRDGGGRRLRLRAALTVVQSTLSVALLIGAGLFVRSVWNARHLPLGFEPDRVLVAEVSRSSLQRFDTSTRDAERARRRRFLSTTLEEIRALPGVAEASVAVGMPFGNRFSVRITVPGLDALPETGTGGPTISAVGSGYFRTIGTRITRGRSFTPEDRAGSAPVAIISEFMARTVWPNEDPIGRCLTIERAAAPCATVVGIAENANRARLVEAPRMHVYIPLGQEAGFGGDALLVRSSGDPAALADAVRRELMGADPTITFVSGETLAARIAPQMRSWELGTSTLLFSGLLALIVSAVGTYSLLAYLVADRRHEIGVRLALGARVDQVAGIVVRWSLALSLAGLALGCLIALLAARFMEPLLFRVSPRDPFVFASVITVLVVVALAASLGPGIRAARVDPLEALRSE